MDSPSKKHVENVKMETEAVNHHVNRPSRGEVMELSWQNLILVLLLIFIHSLSASSLELPESCTQTQTHVLCRENNGVFPHSH